MLHPTLVGLLLLVPAVAHAQDGFDAHGFNLAAFDGDVRDPLTVQRPGRMEPGDWFASGLLEFANNPLVFVVTDLQGQVVEEQQALDDLFVLNTSFGWALVDRLRVDAAVPLYLTSSGLDGAQGVGVGDARLSAMFVAISPDSDERGLGVGLIPYLDLPLGAPGEFLGQGSVAGGAKAAATYEVEHFTLTGEIGAYFARKLALSNLVATDTLTTGLGIGYNVDETLGFTLETHLESPFDANAEPGTASPSEVLLSMRKSAESGPHFLLGGAMAVSRGASAADYRVFLGGGFGRRGPGGPDDTDLDGILDPADACVTDPETVNAYKDEDGCPDGPGKLDVVVLRDGKPVPGAALTVAQAGGDVLDTTTTDQPYTTETWPDRVWEAHATLGDCLAGTSRITTVEGVNLVQVDLKPDLAAQITVEVRDPKGAPIDAAVVKFSAQPDGCSPTEPTQGSGGKADARVGAGAHEIQVSAPGYAIHTEKVTVAKGQTQVVQVTLTPTRVQVTATQIVILDVVYFETNKAVIKPESFALLDEVSTTIRTNPQLGRVEISGHTDSQGSDTANKDLSQRRAEAVLLYLAQHGVDGGRLQAIGYGETKPIDTNATPTGRAKNRRVEFNLVDKR